MLRKIIPDSGFIKNVFTLSIGALIAQVITILSSLILTRLYSPADFGLLSFFLSIVSMFVIFSTGKYELGILLPKTDNEATPIASLSLLITCLVSFVALIFIFPINYFFGEYYKYPELGIWLYFLPAFVFLISVTQVFLNWCIRKKYFNTISNSRIIEAVVLNGVSLLLSKLGSLGLLVANIASQLLSTVFLGIKSLAKDKVEIFSEKKSELKKTIVHYSDFPKHNILQSFTDMFQVSGVIFLVPFFFHDMAIIGLYGLTIRILQAPMWIVVKPITQVFFSQVAEAAANGKKVDTLLFDTMKKTALLTLPMPIILIFFGPILFSFLFGKEWAEAGEYARIISVWFYFDYIRIPASQVIIVIRKQKTLMKLSLIGNLILILSLPLGWFLANDIKTSFLILGISESLFIMGVLLWIYLTTKRYSEHIQPQ